MHLFIYSYLRHFMLMQSQWGFMDEWGMAVLMLALWEQSFGATVGFGGTNLGIFPTFIYSNFKDEKINHCLFLFF